VVSAAHPTEQEGTYQPPEAQVDRFMLKTVIDHLKWMKSAWFKSKLERKL
jgi:MoxR-like ATPase